MRSQNLVRVSFFINFYLLVHVQLGTAFKKSVGNGVKQKRCLFRHLFFVVMEGIEPPTQGFSVLCSTN